MNVHDGKEGEEFRLGVYLTQGTLINIDCIVSGVVCIYIGNSCRSNPSYFLAEKIFGCKTFCGGGESYLYTYFRQATLFRRICHHHSAGLVHNHLCL